MLNKNLTLLNHKKKKTYLSILFNKSLIPWLWATIPARKQTVTGCTILYFLITHKMFSNWLLEYTPLIPGPYEVVQPIDSVLEPKFFDAILKNISGSTGLTKLLTGPEIMSAFKKTGKFIWKKFFSLS